MIYSMAGGLIGPGLRNSPAIAIISLLWPYLLRLLECLNIHLSYQDIAEISGSPSRRAWASKGT